MELTVCKLVLHLLIEIVLRICSIAMRLHTDYVFLPSSSALLAAPRETQDLEKEDLIT